MAGIGTPIAGIHVLKISDVCRMAPQCELHPVNAIIGQESNYGVKSA
jgi:hypothetical protein